jgi:hypothetical protein
MLKGAWQRFRNRRPGFRFHGMYVDHQKASKAAWKRVALIFGGVVVVIVGIIALPAPGPGMLIIALGAGMIARESETLSDALDRLELYLRAKWRRWRPSHR